MTLSNTHIKKLPSKKPKTGINHLGKSVSEESSIEGASKDQKLAAVITPAANPYMQAKTFGLISEKKINTKAEPKLVKVQVISPPNKDKIIGESNISTLAL